MPISYSFSLNGITVHPIYSDDFTLDYEKQSGEEFFRKVLKGSFSFIGDDFTYINNQSIDTEFWLRVNYNDDPTVYAQGKFYKTDCKVNLDDGIIDVDIQAKDNYDNVLAGINNLYDLSKLEVARTKLYIDKRPLIQTYIPDDNTVGCFFNGNSWEQDVIEPTSDPTAFNFALAKTVYRIQVSGDGTPQSVIDDYVSENEDVFSGSNNTYKIEQELVSRNSVLPSNLPTDKTFEDYGSLWTDNNGFIWKMIEVSGNDVIFTAITGTDDMPSSGILTHLEGAVHTIGIPFNSRSILSDYYTFNLIENLSNTIVFFSKMSYSSVLTGGDILFNGYLNGGIGSGNVVGFKQKIDLYARLLLDSEYVLNIPTNELPLDDIVEYNRNYKRVIGYAIDGFTITSNRSVTPTNYGISDDGKYFLPPSGFDKYYPLSRSNWGLSSLWFNFSIFNDQLDIDGSKTFLSRRNMLISDVIKALLSEIDINITHDGTTDYSELLYSTSNPLTGANSVKMINQKSNIKAGELDTPAQKEEIRLSTITDMLKNMYEAYWFIDDQSRFRIEHISWFKNGGSYSTAPTIGEDLTTLIDTRNKKPFALYSSNYEYDKETLPERYEFSWMDEVTDVFKGYPIIINSKYVERGNIDQRSITDITTDLDYILLNPIEISNDGYCFLDAIENIEPTGDVESQNGYYDSSNGNFVADANRLSMKVDTKDFSGDLYVSAIVNGVSNALAVYYDYLGNFISSEGLGNSTASITYSNFKLTIPANARTIGLSNFDTVYTQLLTQFYKTAIFNVSYENATLRTQNAYGTWLYIHPFYWTNNLPSSNFDMNNGLIILPTGIKRSKIQVVNYPSLDDPDPTKLIKTYLGNGDIEKISVNLSNRNNEIELRYDTE